MAKAKTIKVDAIETAEIGEVGEVDIKSVPISEVLQNAINSELQRFNPFQQRMENIKAYKDLKIMGVDDKEGYEANRQAIAVCRKIRTDSKNDKQLIKAPFLNAASMVEERFKEIIAEVKEIETPLQIQKDEIDQQIDIAKETKKRLDQEQYTKRTAILTKMGVEISDGGFKLGDVEFTFSAIKDAPQDAFDGTILPAFQEVFEVRERERIEKENKEREAMEKRTREMEEFEQRQRDFAEQQRVFRVQQEEAEREKEKKRMAEEEENQRIASELRKTRATELMKLGFAFFPFEDEWKFGQITVTDSCLLKSPEDWASLIEKLTISVKDEREQIAKEDQERLEKQAQERAEQMMQKEREEAKEKERKRLEDLAEAGEKEKWQDFINQVNKLTFPEFKSGQYINLVLVAKGHIDAIKNLKAKRSN